MTPASSSVLPGVQDTEFLRACLLEGAEARTAWEHWLGETTSNGETARRALAAVNALLPLLAWHLPSTGATIEPELQTHFRSALLTEELRWQKYRRICDEAFAALRGDGIAFIALGGAVIGELVYPAVLLRHAADVRVLVHAADLDRAGGTMAAAGWRRRPSPALASPIQSPPLVHPEGVTMQTQRRLAIPWYTLPYDRLWERSRVVPISGADVRVLSEGDALIETIAHASAGHPDLRWIVDAWFMLTKTAAFDWRAFVETACAARMELPVSRALRYLADDLRAPVSPEALTELESRAAHAGASALAAARPWPTRRLFPPPRQFALHYDVPLPAVPLYYVLRVWFGVVGSR